MKTIIDKKDRAIEITPIKRENVNAGNPPRNFCTRFWESLVFGVKPDPPSRFTLAISHPGVLRKIFWRLSSRKRQFTLAISHPGVLRKIFWRPGARKQGEAHIFKEIEIEGNREVAVVLREILNGFEGKVWGSFGLRSFCYLCLYFLGPQRISIRYFCGARPLRVGEPGGLSVPIVISPPMFFTCGWQRASIKPASISEPALILDPCR